MSVGTYTLFKKNELGAFEEKLVTAQAEQVLGFDANLNPIMVSLPSAVVVPGASTQVLFNDADAFGADAGFTYDKANKNILLTGAQPRIQLKNTESVDGIAGSAHIELLTSNNTVQGRIGNYHTTNNSLFVLSLLGDLYLGTSGVTADVKIQTADYKGLTINPYGTTTFDRGIVIGNDTDSTINGTLRYTGTVLEFRHSNAWVNLLASGGGSLAISDTSPSASSYAFWFDPTTGALGVSVDSQWVKVTASINSGEGGAYVHPTIFSSKPSVALSGATVISQVVVNNEGHLTGVETRNLTAANIGAEPAQTKGSLGANLPLSLSNDTRQVIGGDVTISHSDSEGYKHIPAGGSANQIIAYDGPGVGAWASMTDLIHGNRGNGSLHSVATTSVAGFMSGADKTKLNGIAPNANYYELPTASVHTLGGVKVGTGLSISNGVLSPSPHGVTSGYFAVGNTATAMRRSYLLHENTIGVLTILPVFTDPIYFEGLGKDFFIYTADRSNGISYRKGIVIPHSESEDVKIGRPVANINYYEVFGGLVLGAASGTEDGTVQYDSVSGDFWGRKAGAWVSLTGGGDVDLIASSISTNSVTVSLATNHTVALTNTGNLTITVNGGTAGKTRTVNVVINSHSSNRIASWTSGIFWQDDVKLITLAAGWTYFVTITSHGTTYHASFTRMKA